MSVPIGMLYRYHRFTGKLM
uniref:Uncharacterized protein n=1 Tax=Arundo donax TaxID=35708 RepID=A0A0A9EBS1_ARUDO